MKRFLLPIAAAFCACIIGMQASAEVQNSGFTRLAYLEKEIAGRVSPRVLKRFLLPPKKMRQQLYTPNYIDGLAQVKGGKEWSCLTEALYFEARSETIEGQFAVGEVILNRRDSARFPDTVCGVLDQGSSRRNGCQFSYNCDGRAEHMNEEQAKIRAQKIAKLLLDGLPRDLTDGATHYHGTYVSPSWSKRLRRTTTIGQHVFYNEDRKISQR